MGKRKKKGFIRGIPICLACLAIIVILGGLGFGALLIADGNYVFFRDRIVWFLGKDNHFEGESWFSAGVTLLGAIISTAPGLLCGVFALVQTHRLHVLESRYHRPVMDLSEAELKVIKMGDITELFDNVKLDTRQCHSIRMAFDKNCKYCIDLQVVFFLKNETLIKTLSVKKVFFSFYNGIQYRLEPMENMEEGNRHKAWDFERKLIDGQMKYTWAFSLRPLIQEPRVQERELEEFIFYRERRNPEYQYMTMNIYINICYEYDGGQEVENLLKVEFDAAQTKYGKLQMTNQSSNGYFTFDIEG